MTYSIRHNPREQRGKHWQVVRSDGFVVAAFARRVDAQADADQRNARSV